jgi:hypothetical protein
MKKCAPNWRAMLMKNKQIMLSICVLCCFSCCKNTEDNTLPAASTDAEPQSTIKEQADGMVERIMSERLESETNFSANIPSGDSLTFDDYTNKLGKPIYADSFAINRMKPDHWARAIRNNLNIREQGKDAIILEIWWGSEESWLVACFYSYMGKWPLCMAKASPSKKFRDRQNVE